MPLDRITKVFMKRQRKPATKIVPVRFTEQELAIVNELMRRLKCDSVSEVIRASVIETAQKVKVK